MTFDTTTNKRVWDEVKHTDPRFTKPFNKGSFKGTDVDPMYQVGRATEVFGPIGHGWGYEVVESDIVKDGESSYVYVKIAFWTVIDGKEGKPFHHYGTAMLTRDAKSGNRQFNDEAHKSAVTNALGKALSMLGFSADVYLGLHDNAEYVGRMRQRFSTNGTTNNGDNGHA